MLPCVEGIHQKGSLDNDAEEGQCGCGDERRRLHMSLSHRLEELSEAQMSHLAALVRLVRRHAGHRSAALHRRLVNDAQVEAVAKTQKYDRSDEQQTGP